jgi:hypothetical protein
MVAYGIGEGAAELIREDAKGGGGLGLGLEREVEGLKV